MTKTTDRRDFLAHAPAVALAVTAGSAVVALPAVAAEPVDPHLEWWRKRQDLLREYETIKRQTDAIFAAAPPTPGGLPVDWPRDVYARYAAYLDASEMGDLDAQSGDLMAELNRLEDLIAGTTPSTLEGAAIVAAMLLADQELMGSEDCGADLAGRTLANFVQALAGEAQS